MTDLRKAAEIALEALEDEPKLLGDWLDNLKNAREALRQALAQPEQDELLKQGWRQCAVGQRTTQYCGMVEQARTEEREACAKLLDVYAPINLKSIAAAIRARNEAQPPCQTGSQCIGGKCPECGREWVDLTDEEIKEVYVKRGVELTFNGFARAIEVRLKEKNSG